MSNSEPTPEEFAEYLATDLLIGVQIAKLNKRRATNMAQYEGIGGDRDEIRVGRKLDKLGPSFISMVGRVGGYMGYLTVEEDGQGSFAKAFEEPPMPTASKAAGRIFLINANMDGFNSALAGGTTDDNPHPPGSEIYEQWDKGCREGMAERELRVAAKEAKDERKVGMTHIEPEATPQEQGVEAAEATGTKPKAARKPRKGLVPNTPTAEDIAEQAADARPVMASTSLARSAGTRSHADTACGLMRRAQASAATEPAAWMARDRGSSLMLAPYPKRKSAARRNCSLRFSAGSASMSCDSQVQEAAAHA